MTTTSFQREPLTDALWDEIMPLLVAHWREIAHYQDIMLDPDLEVYRSAAERDMLRIYTVRVNDAPDEIHQDACTGCRLAGYAIFFVKANAHYRGSLQAHQDIMFVDPACRGMTGSRLVTWCEEQLRVEGVQAVYHHVKVAHNFGTMLERKGYELVDHIYAKRLDV